MDGCMLDFVYGFCGEEQNIFSGFPWVVGKIECPQLKSFDPKQIGTTNNNCNDKLVSDKSHSSKLYKYKYSTYTLLPFQFLSLEYDSVVSVSDFLEHRRNYSLWNSWCAKICHVYRI